MALYDDPSFYERYSQLPRSVEGLDAAPEWRSILEMLPEVGNGRILDLGCGYGWFSRWAAAHGANAVLGVDVSDRMLRRAVELTEDAAIEYVQADLEVASFDTDAYDLVFSSLCLHYVADLERLLSSIQAALKPGCRLVFSVEHPIYTAPTTPIWSTSGSGGRKTWPLDSYSREGRRETNWLGGRVVKYHRTMATYLSLLLKHGLQILMLEEWKPSPAQLSQDPSLEDELDRPMFLLLSAERRT